MVGLSWIKASAAVGRGTLREVGPVGDARGRSFQGRNAGLDGTTKGQRPTNHSDGK